MPLLPELQPLMDLINSVPKQERLADDAQQVVHMRESMKLLGAVLPQADANEGPEIRSVDNQTLKFGADSVPVRVYQPTTKPIALIAYFHGGGFVIGDLDTHDGLCRRFAALFPAVVVSVDYRLAPENAFPGGVNDCFNVTKWAQEHAGDFGLSPDKVFVAGDSAGGNLAAVISQMHSREVTSGVSKSKLAGQVLLYPVTDMRYTADDVYPSRKENATGYLLTDEMMREFHHFYEISGADVNDVRVSPLLNPDLSNLPPALVVTAEFDPLRDEGEKYADLLKSHGNSVETKRFDGAIHGFMQFPDTMSCVSQGDQLVADFIRRHS